VHIQQQLTTVLQPQPPQLFVCLASEFIVQSRAELLLSRFFFFVIKKPVSNKLFSNCYVLIKST